MRHLLHKLSVVNVYVLLFCFIFLLQRHTIGILPWFKSSPVVFDITPMDFVFMVTTVFFICKYFKVTSPYNKKR